MPSVPRFHWCVVASPAGKLAVMPLANNTDAAMGIALICGIVTPKFNRSVGTAIDISCFSISVGLNLLLTLMIVARLAVHSKNIRKAMGGSDGAGRLYQTIITVLVESCALYSACLTVYIGLYGSGNTAQLLVFPIVSVVQVSAVPRS